MDVKLFVPKADSGPPDCTLNTLLLDPGPNPLLRDCDAPDLKSVIPVLKAFDPEAGTAAPVVPELDVISLASEKLVPVPNILPLDPVVTSMLFDPSRSPLLAAPLSVPLNPVPPKPNPDPPILVSEPNPVGVVLNSDPPLLTPDPNPVPLGPKLKPVLLNPVLVLEPNPDPNPTPLTLGPNPNIVLVDPEANPVTPKGPVLWYKFSDIRGLDSPAEKGTGKVFCEYELIICESEVLNTDSPVCMLPRFLSLLTFLATPTSPRGPLVAELGTELKLGTAGEPNTDCPDDRSKSLYAVLLAALDVFKENPWELENAEGDCCPKPDPLLPSIFKVKPQLGWVGGLTMLQIK